MIRRLLQIQIPLMLCLIAGTFGTAYAQETCTFIEEGGILTVEMESADISGGFWTKRTAIPGHSGDSYLEYTGGHLTGLPGNSELTYTFRINEPGVYSFKTKAYRTGMDVNDVWVRFPDGGVITKYNGENTGTIGNNWFKYMIGPMDRWYYMLKTQIDGYPHEILHDVYVEFPQAGIYTIQFSGRSTGFIADRFTLYNTSGFFGMNPANPQSQKENCAPILSPYVANPFSNQRADHNQLFTYTFSENVFLHPEDKMLDYHATLRGALALPDWLSFDPASRTFSGMPATEDISPVYVTVKAQDPDGKYAVGEFRITIGNQTPERVGLFADTTAIVSKPFEYIINPSFFNDPDGDPLQITVTGSNHLSLPDWINYDENLLKISGTPAEEHVGVDTVYVTANDGNGGEIETWFILNTLIPQGKVYSLKHESISVFPNPFEREFIIQNLSNITLNAKILDISGRVIDSTFYISGQEGVMVGDGLEKGTYILIVSNEVNEILYQQIVLKK